MAREVLITGPIAGHNFSYQGNDVVELPDDVAAAWIESGMAVEVPKARKGAALVAENEALKARVAELEAENASLKAAPAA